MTGTNEKIRSNKSVTQYIYCIQSLHSTLGRTFRNWRDRRPERHAIQKKGSNEVAHTSNPELMRVRQKDHPEVRWAILIPCLKRKKEGSEAIFLSPERSLYK